jgi:Mg-chelatase subunit ChlD
MRKLRLARTPFDAQAQIICDGAPAVFASEEILSYLANSSQLSSFLAEPAMLDGGAHVDWYARISGTAMPLVELQGGDRATAEERLQFRLEQLRSLADALPESRQKRLLVAAASYPGPESIFVIGQEPVLSQWGSRSARPAATVALPKARLARPTAEQRSGAWIPVLIFLLVFAALAAVAWFNRQQFLALLEPPAQVATTQPVQLQAALQMTAALQAEQKRADDLRQQIQDLRKAFESKKASCAAPQPPQQPLPPPAPEQKTDVPAPPAPPAKNAETKPKPVTSKPEVVAALPQPSKETTPTPAQSCKAALQARKPWEAPEVVFVIDSSGSMGESVGGETRLDAAKESVSVVADSLPADVDTALVKFTACNEIDNDYFLPRDLLKQKVNALFPEGGTPLARSIERAANILSKKKDTVMIVVTDGEDSCNQKDPCKVAAAAKASHPNLTINVVDVSGNGLGTCIARAGGGSVIPARTPAEIKAAIQQATLPQTMPSACRGGN